jgi:hypothetical protein
MKFWRKRGSFMKRKGKFTHLTLNGRAKESLSWLGEY